MRIRISGPFILLCCLFLSTVSQISNSVEGDRQALMDLYNATNGANWKNNSGWGEGNPSDSWHGVQVDVDGRVVRLDLYKNGLDGTLPASIGNLTKLKYLNIKGNRLTGTIPSEIGKMEAMEWLILAGRTYLHHGLELKEPPQDLAEAYHPGKRASATNLFTGGIPTTIGNLSNLKRFELSGQVNMDATIPPELFNNCENLEGIYMSWNVEGLSGRLPSEINSCTQLAHLYLANNTHSGDFPDITNLTNLRYINIGTGNASVDNAFTGEFPDVSNAKQLHAISIDKNDFSGDFPQYWNTAGFTNLRNIGAAWNNLTGTMPDSFDNLELDVIRVGGNNIGGGLDWLTTLHGGVRIVSFHTNNFTGTFPQTGWPGQVKSDGSYGSGFWDIRNFEAYNNPGITGTLTEEFFIALGYSDNFRRLLIQKSSLSGIDKQAFEMYIYNDSDGQGGTYGRASNLSRISFVDNNFDCSPHCFYSF